MAKQHYISLPKFKKLKPGDKVVIRFMLGQAIVASKPSIEKNPIKSHLKESIDIRFNSGPWKGRTLKLIRQQISNTSRSFPVRDVYVKK